MAASLSTTEQHQSDDRPAGGVAASSKNAPVANQKDTYKGNGKGKGSNRPSSEEIEAKRAARAQKKQREAEEKTAKEEAIRQSLLVSGDSDGRVPGGHLDSDGKPLYVSRAWAETASDDIVPKHTKKVKFLSWNILAQGLVRRKLFPGSDCLKFKDRCAGLTAEMSSRTGHGWDVGCFQEVDRMDVHGETLERDQFAYVYEKGYRNKQHGLLIAWRKAMFGPREYGRMLVDLDEEEVCDSAEGSEPGRRRRTACSRVTRNVGLFVSLRFADAAEQQQDGSPGVIVATTHLFWHPMHAYERARQSGILVRKLDAYRSSLGPAWRNATTVLAGDFNDQPHSATYHLLTGKKLTPHCLQEISESTVVHKSIDEKRERMQQSSSFERPGEKAGTTQQEAGLKVTDDGARDETEEEQKPDEEGEEAEEEEEEEEGGADDRMLKNCRAATPADGLLSVDELLQLHDLSRPRPGREPATAGKTAREGSEAVESISDDRASRLGLLSSYGSKYGSVVDPPEQNNFFGTAARGRERHDEEWIEGQRNVHTGDSKEPMWTIFSSLFSLTLDYIFLFPAAAVPDGNDATEKAEEGQRTARFPAVTRLLRTHRTETLQPGIPRKGVCASDHVAVGAEVACNGGEAEGRTDAVER